MSERTFHILTFGCQMNAGDSLWLSRALTSLGFQETSYEEARIIILNTCSVREKPEHKVYTELGRVRLLAEANPERGVFACVGGCVAQQLGEKLFSRSAELRLVFGTDGLAGAPQAIAALTESPEPRRLALLDFTDDYEEKDGLIELGTKTPTAFVNIMQGCNNFCAYCIVPFVRGRQKSRSAKAILDECRKAVAHGARDITLLGQNVNSYGLDDAKKDEPSREEPSPFASLLRSVAAIPGLERLRFTTSHPKDIAPEVIAAFGDMDGMPNLTPHLHLPLQSGSDRILKLMGRKYDSARFMDIVSALRKARPDIQLTTDIICGFPGETEEDFAATMEMMRAADFFASFSFIYSDRPGARAVNFSGKVPRAEALERLARLQAWQSENTSRILQEQIGTTVSVLLEGNSLKESMPDAPESDATGDVAVSWYGKDMHGFAVNVLEPEGIAFRKGDIVSVRVAAAGRHTLKGVLCKP